MSMAEMVRNSARQGNERRVSDLAAKLDVLRTQEIRTSDDLVTAFRPLVETMADLLRDVDQGREQTADMLDRMEQALNRMEFAMGQAPARLQAAVASSTEGQAERLGAVAEAMERLGQTLRGRMAQSLKDAGATSKELKGAGESMAEVLPSMRAAVTAMQEAAEQAGHRRFVGPLMMVLTTGLVTSVLSAWLVCRTFGYQLRLWP